MPLGSSQNHRDELVAIMTGFVKDVEWWNAWRCLSVAIMLVWNL